MTSQPFALARASQSFFWRSTASFFPSLSWLMRVYTAARIAAPCNSDVVATSEATLAQVVIECGLGSAQSLRSSGSQRARRARSGGRADLADGPARDDHDHVHGSGAGRSVRAMRPRAYFSDHVRRVPPGSTAQGRGISVVTEVTVPVPAMHPWSGRGAPCGEAAPKRLLCSLTGGHQLPVRTHPITVVPRPGSLRTSSVPPTASRRSAMPCRPVPYWVTLVSKPRPSSTIRNCSLPPSSARPTVTALASAYLATLFRASSVQK